MGDYWQLTIDILQNDSNPIVDKPKLQEKYLTKPPFRYLHDIVTAVQNNTGFAPGLFTGEELDAKAIQDKDAKVTYLTKIIDVVGIVLGQPVPAKPLKIVAGLEPESTNVFLQMLGNACKLGNGAAAVQQVLGGGEASSSKPERTNSRRTSQQQEDLPPAAAEPPQRTSPNKTKRASETKESKERDSKESKERSKDRSSRDGGGSSSKDRGTLGRQSSSKDREKEKEKESSTKRSSKTAEEGPPPLSPATQVDTTAADDPMRRSLMRPQSARKAPPKANTSFSSPTSGGGAPSTPPGGGGGSSIVSGAAGNSRKAGDRPMDTMRIPGQSNRPVSVMAEGAAGDSDDDVEVVHEAVPVAIGAHRDGGERGVLVKNIMEAEQNLKKAGEEAVGGGEESSGTGIILGKRLGKAGAAAGAAGSVGGAAVVRTTDTTAIQEMVQKLCQSSHPLAKSMDYLQEDLENMAKEYRFWQVERRMFADKLASEQRLLVDSVAAETQLADLDGQVKQVRDRILGIKGQLLRNDETIGKLLNMAVGR